MPSGKTFFAAGKDSILDAGLQAGLSLAYGCSNGNCGKCKGRLVSGDVQRVRHHDYVINDAEKSMGVFLLCSYAPVTDVVVEAAAATDAEHIPRQNITARLKSIVRLDDAVISVRLQTPRTHRLRFLAGQYVTLELASGARFDYPIASCPCDDRNIEFHFRVEPDNTLAREVARLNARDAVVIEGPSGDFTLGPVADQSLVFIAWDIGFAPIKSLIEHAMQQELDNEMYLFYLLPHDSDPYLAQVIRAWSDAFDQFHYAPVLLPFSHHEAVGDINRGGEDFTRAFDPPLAARLPSADSSIYIAAPHPVPALVEALLVDANVPAERIKTAAIHLS